ncbi:MAG: hypothetical protein QXO86_06650 [Nitrososphaerota archaeon]
MAKLYWKRVHSGYLFLVCGQAGDIRWKNIPYVCTEKEDGTYRYVGNHYSDSY